MKYIDADKLRAEIERRIETYKKGYANGDDCRADALEVLLHDLSFLDTLEEPENPIYELNQFLIDWIRDGQTDAEKDARWEAYRRFFELHDEAMMREPEVDLEKEIEEYWIATGWSKHITLGKFKVIARYFYGLGQLNAK